MEVDDSPEGEQLNRKMPVDEIWWLWGRFYPECSCAFTCPAGVRGAVSGISRLQSALHHSEKLADSAAQPMAELYCDLQVKGGRAEEQNI